MSSLAEFPELVGFFSYSREDDGDSHGALSALRNRVQGELRGLLGRTAKTFRLWQDKEAIASGTLWESEIKNAIAQSVFFVPIITPTVVASPYCRFELEAFLAREAELGRDDLVFPILYIDVPALEDAARRQNDPVLSLIAKRQYVDWREFRYLDIDSTEVKRQVGRFCTHIRDALHRQWVSPEERKSQEEAVARKQAEAERQRQEAEAAHRAEVEQRRALELEAKERAEAEKRQREAEAQQKKAEVERQKIEQKRLRDEDAQQKKDAIERQKAEQRRLRQKQDRGNYNSEEVPEAEQSNQIDQVNAAAAGMLFGRLLSPRYVQISLIASGSVCSLFAIWLFCSVFVLKLLVVNSLLALFIICLAPLPIGLGSAYVGVALARGSKPAKIVNLLVCFAGIFLDVGAILFIALLVPSDQFIKALSFNSDAEFTTLAYQFLVQALSVFAHGPALLFILFGSSRRKEKAAGAAPP